MVDTTRIITPEGEFVSRFFNRKIGWANHAFFVTGLLLVSSSLLSSVVVTSLAHIVAPS